MNVRSPKALLLCCLVVLTALPLGADSTTASQSSLTPEAAEKQTRRVLDILNKGNYDSEPETLGFRFLFTSGWLSAFDYKIYGGAISSTIPITVIRIEGDSGDAHLLTRVMELEGILKVTTQRPRGISAVRPESKSHIYSQGLNLMAPWLAVLYNGYRSPRLTSNQMWARFAAYFLWDVLAVYAAGSNGFKTRYIAGENAGAMAAALAASRLLGAWQNFHLTYGHNRLAELKYTFYLHH